MAKSIEEKAVDALATALTHTQFRPQEFCRIMTEQYPVVHKSFFQLLVGYINYLAVFESYNWYPDNTQRESHISSQVVDTMNRLANLP